MCLGVLNFLQFLTEATKIIVRKKIRGYKLKIRSNDHRETSGHSDVVLSAKNFSSISFFNEFFQRVHERTFKTFCKFFVHDI